MLETIDPQIIAFIVILLGATVTQAIPYILKNWEQAIPFEISCLYSYVVAMVLAVIAILPGEPDITFQGCVLLFCAGSGLDWMTNKANTVRMKRKVLAKQARV